MLRPLLLLIVGAMTPLCALEAQGVGNATLASVPMVRLPAALDRVLRDYESAWRAGDAAALAALFVENGFVLQPDRGLVRGRQAIQRAYAGQGGGPLRLRALAFATSGDVGYIIGAYGYGENAAEVGKFTLTLQRSPNRKWLIVSDMDNSSVSRTLPPASQPAAPGAPPPRD